jgi:hypothetical protein
MVNCGYQWGEYINDGVGWCNKEGLGCHARLLTSGGSVEWWQWRTAKKKSGTNWGGTDALSHFLRAFLKLHTVLVQMMIVILLKFVLWYSSSRSNPTCRYYDIFLLNPWNYLARYCSCVRTQKSFDKPFGIVTFNIVMTTVNNNFLADCVVTMTIVYNTL